MKFAAVLLLGCALFAVLPRTSAGGGGDEDATASLPGVVDLSECLIPAVKHSLRDRAITQPPAALLCSRLQPRRTWRWSTTVVVRL